MKALTVTVTSLAVVLIVSLNGCSHTLIEETWSRPATSVTGLDKVAVLGMTDRPMTRRILEDDLVKDLRDKGVSADQVYMLGSVKNMPEPDSMKSILGPAGYDAILVAQPVADSQRIDYVRGRHYWTDDDVDIPFYDYYDDAYWHYNAPGYYVVSDVVKIETRLYDLPSGDMIWSAVSSTIKNESVNGYIRDYSSTIIDQMADNHLIGAK